MSKKKEAGIFDWDDTIITGPKSAYDSFYLASAEEVGADDMHPSTLIERINHRWGARHEVIIAEMFKDRPDISIEKRRHASNFFMDLMRNKFAQHVNVVPSAIETLELLKEERGMKLGVSTACPPEVLFNHVMPQINFPPELFDYVITSYDLVDQSKVKPHPYTLNKIMTKLQVSPSRAFMVGDSHNDFFAAKSAHNQKGIDFIGVKTGVLNSAEAKRIGVRYLVNNVAEIVPVIDALEKKENGLTSHA